jgi:hypothetical protein
LAGAAVSPPGPQRIIAQMLRACGIQVQVQVLVLVLVLVLVHVPGTWYRRFWPDKFCKNLNISKF